jgi:hypothetical protein
VNIYFGRLYRIILVVDGGGRTGKIENLVDLHVERECDVMTYQLKIRIAQKVNYVASAASIKIVNANNLKTFFQQSFAKV